MIVRMSCSIPMMGRRCDLESLMVAGIERGRVTVQSLPRHPVPSTASFISFMSRLPLGLSSRERDCRGFLTAS